MKMPILLAALFVAGAAQAVPPAPAAQAPSTQAGATPALTARRFPGVSDAGNAVLAKMQTTPDPQLQALERASKAAHNQLLSVVMAPVIDPDKLASALKAQDDALSALRARNTDRVIAVVGQLPAEDRGTFLRTLVLAQTQRPAPPVAAPAKPQP